MRGLDDNFVNDLLDGSLRQIWQTVKSNKLLKLEIRDNYINIYYKGGNALKITKLLKGYSFKFDTKYCIGSASEHKQTITEAIKLKEPDKIHEFFPMILQSMNTYFEVYPKLERNIQHELIAGSHQGLCVVDIEYRDPGHTPHTCRIDMIGVVKVDKGYRLVIIENKQGEKSINGSSGIKKHYNDFVNLINDPDAFSRLKNSVIQIINNKKHLKLSDIELKYDDLIETEILFVIFGVDQNNESIKNVIASIKQSLPAKIIYMPYQDRNIPYLKATDLFNEI